jgi:muconolactone delta-isomerase
MPSNAQTMAAATQSTKILAIGMPTSGVNAQDLRRLMPAEMRATAELYLEGKIDQWYSVEGRPGVVFIFNVTDVESAKAMLESLPLGRAHLITFELTSLGPLAPLRQLMLPPSAQ